MKETLVKINKTESWPFEKINKIDKLQSDSSSKKERRIKSIKLEIKKERLQQTMQKHKDYETTTDNYMQIKWITQKKQTDSQRGTTFQD